MSSGLNCLLYFSVILCLYFTICPVLALEAVSIVGAANTNKPAIGLISPPVSFSQIGPEECSSYLYLTIRQLLNLTMF